MSNLEDDDDGLGSFDLSQLGMKTGAFGGAKILKFTKNFTFSTREGELIEPTRELLLVGLVKIVQKFVGGELVNTIPVGPHDNFPDIEAMNAAAPQSEWGISFGKPQGPFQKLLILKLLDEKTMDRYVFITNSMGGSIAIGDVTDKCKIRRQLQGTNVAPVVRCSSTRFKTKYNPNDRRPHFEIVRWIELRRDVALAKPAELPQLTSAPATATPVAPPTPKWTGPPASAATPPTAPTATPPTAPAPAAASTAATAASIVPEDKPIGTPVADPTLAQELDDKIVF